MSVLYTSPTVLPEPFYRRPMIGFSDELEHSSPELKDAEAGRISSMSSQNVRHRGQVESAQPASSALRQASYPSLMLQTQLEALRHYHHRQQQQQVCEDAAANGESRSHCSTATESPPISCETSAFHQPRRRRLTPEHSTPDTGVQLTIARQNTPVRLQMTDGARLQTRKTGKFLHS